MMSDDRREAILSRLLEVFQGLEGIQTVVRNKEKVADKDRPAVQLFDADETASDLMNGQPPSRARGVNLVSMNPEVYILLQEVPENVGTVLNLHRAALIKAVLTDAQLVTLVGPNGGIKYEGCATALSRGRAVEGELGLAFTFTYPLFPSQL
jgi:hypothetical protein